MRNSKDTDMAVPNADELDMPEQEPQESTVDDRDRKNPFGGKNPSGARKKLDVADQPDFSHRPDAADQPDFPDRSEPADRTDTGTGRDTTDDTTTMRTTKSPAGKHSVDGTTGMTDTTDTATTGTAPGTSVNGTTANGTTASGSATGNTAVDGTTATASNTPAGTATGTAPANGTPTGTTTSAAARPVNGEHHVDLFESGDLDKYQEDWRSVQASFVDDPAASVREADALVGRMVETITSRISEQRNLLSQHNDGADGEHTEQLRQALRDYRSMFQQLLPSSH